MFNEETDLLSDSNTNSLKSHYMTLYWRVHKDFLDYIEHSMSHDSLIGSAISTRSKKSVSCAKKISFPSVLSHDTKSSKDQKYQRKTTYMIFILRTSIMHFYPNQTLSSTVTILRRTSTRLLSTCS
jgi:hypothetical protein